MEEGTFTVQAKDRPANASRFWKLFRIEQPKEEKKDGGTTQ